MTTAASTLTPYPEPTPTIAPSPIPNGTPLEETKTPTPTPETTVYDGPTKSGKSLRDLFRDLGFPESVATMIDEAQEAVLGIIGDLTGSSATERKSVADILGHGNRLRGLGSLCVLVALVGLFIEATVGESLHT